jgi:hypothetical protein
MLPFDELFEVVFEPGSVLAAAFGWGSACEAASGSKKKHLFVVSFEPDLVLAVEGLGDDSHCCLSADFSRSSSN